MPSETLVATNSFGGMSHKLKMLLKKSLTESVQPRRRRNFNGIDRLYARPRGIEGGSPALEALLIGLAIVFLSSSYQKRS